MRSLLSIDSIKQQRFTNIDTIKLPASICIVFHHYQQLFNYSFSVKALNFYGGFIQYGFLVELFFVISGLLATYSLKPERGFVSLFASRLKKIYPSALLSVFVSFITIVIYQIKFGGEYLGCSLFNAVHHHKFSSCEPRVGYRICPGYQ